ncbi:MAG: AAA family ATPase [Rhizonema sp. PD38]|nr:AAA family ATPase [Rhizonema sp. PD38]
MSDIEWRALELIRLAWEILIEAGLATYSTKTELCQVVIRFLALVSFYVEFCNDGNDWECYIKPYFKEWIKVINLNLFDHRLDIKHPDYWDVFLEEEQLGSSTLSFINNALQEIRAALTKGFGNESMLLDSLYSSISIKQDSNKYNEEDEISAFYTEQDEILSEAIITAEKIADWEKMFEDSEQCDDYDFYESETILIEMFENTEGKNDCYFDDTQKIIIENAVLFNKFYTGLEEIQQVMSAAESLKEVFSYPKQNQKYTIAKCVEETGFEKIEIERWVRAINRKGQAIICGSPGTGKTFIAEKLAEHLIGKYGFKKLVQFHPAYSYEDFIQGIRPQTQDGKLTYPLLPGHFLEFCKKAESCQNTCVFIIDEINRANLALVFGELMYLLEYRDKEIPLASGNSFRIPKNVRIIGTMNTSDRSIAEFDYALRRRFAFIELRPNYDVLQRYHLKTGCEVEGLIKTLQRLNQVISDKNYEIGISFFLTDYLREDIEDIWLMEVEPYLEEYFFNQPDKVDEFRWNKVKQELSL